MIISTTCSNKSCSALNFEQKSQGTRMSISPRSGARGLERLPSLKYYHALKKLQIFQKLWKKLKFLRKFLQNFILCQEIPGRSSTNFWRDYQQILKKHKKVFHKNYQRNLK